VVAVLAATAMGSGDPAAVRLDVLATLGYVANWHFAYDDAGYFASFGEPSPLRHAWTLAVEEQWYLLWPPALWALWRVSRRRTGVLVGACVAGALVSAGVMAWLADDIDRVHYGTDTRSQALLLGAALALALHHRPIEGWRPVARRGLALVGILAVGALGWMTVVAGGTEPWVYRGGHLLASILATVVVAAALVPGPLTRLLSLRAVCWVGLVSYGFYLWHWPVFIWLSPSSTRLDLWPLFGVRVAVSLVLAALSARFVERPFRLRQVRLRRPALTALAATAAAAVLAVAVGTIPDRGGSSSELAAAPPLPAGFSLDDGTPPGAGALPDAAAATALPPPGQNPPNGVLDVVVVGDSTGWTLTYQIAEPPGMRITSGAVLGCGVDPAAVMLADVPTVVVGDPVPCDFAPEMWEFVATNEDPDVVLLSFGAWEVFDRELPDGTRLDVGTPEWSAWLTEDLRSLTGRLAAAAPDAVIAIPRVPCFDEREDWLGGPDSPRNDPQRVADVNAVLDEFALANPDRVALLPMDDWLCPGGSPAGEIDGVRLRYDGVHFTSESATHLWAERLGPSLSSLVPTP
jgi:peptidoglycan/LPS O-acetylase OafA/YrhL